MIPSASASRRTLPLTEPEGNGRTRPAVFFLDPNLYRAFPPPRRAYLVALFNLLLAHGRPGDVVRPTQLELAQTLGLSRRQVQYLECDLEELGAVRTLRDLPGLRGGRALELVPFEDWLPDELLHRPEHAVSKSRPRKANCGELVDNSVRVAPRAPHVRTECAPQPEVPLIPARARQSQMIGIDQTRVHACASSNATDGATPAPLLARRLFGFLARHTGMSGRTWRQAFPALEALARALGPDAAWSEVERIAKAARSAINPGGYAFSCLFPEGRPARGSTSLRALEGLSDPGPLFRGLDEERAGKASSRPPSARSPCDATSSTEGSPSAQSAP